MNETMNIPGMRVLRAVPAEPPVSRLIARRLSDNALVIVERTSGVDESTRAEYAAIVRKLVALVDRRLSKPTIVPSFQGEFAISWRFECDATIEGLIARKFDFTTKRVLELGIECLEALNATDSAGLASYSFDPASVCLQDDGTTVGFPGLARYCEESREIGAKKEIALTLASCLAGRVVSDDRDFSAILEDFARGSANEPRRLRKLRSEIANALRGIHLEQNTAGDAANELRRLHGALLAGSAGRGFTDALAVLLRKFIPGSGVVRTGGYVLAVVVAVFAIAISYLISREPVPEAGLSQDPSGELAGTPTTDPEFDLQRTRFKRLLREAIADERFGDATSLIESFSAKYPGTPESLEALALIRWLAQQKLIVRDAPAELFKVRIETLATIEGTTGIREGLLRAARDDESLAEIEEWIADELRKIEDASGQRTIAADADEVPSPEENVTIAPETPAETFEVPENPPPGENALDAEMELVEKFLAHVRNFDYDAAAEAVNEDGNDDLIRTKSFLLDALTRERELIALLRRRVGAGGFHPKADLFLAQSDEVPSPSGLTLTDIQASSLLLLDADGRANFVQLGKISAAEIDRLIMIAFPLEGALDTSRFVFFTLRRETPPMTIDDLPAVDRSYARRLVEIIEAK
ncbi:MAG: hypothetical protein NUW37_13245 [Planctomycetes bacterium]|nr:hypothetical protein [Planctomycetota bacterium]